MFASFFQAGFECSTHRRRDGVRLDLTAATEHDRFALPDYRLAAAHGLGTVRDGLRWHRIEQAPGIYDWRSWVPMLRAATRAGVQAIWDVWHYGTPDFVDIWSPDFVERLARFAEAAARVHRDETDSVPLWCPVNEISFFAWIAGQCAEFHPYAADRSYELKRQLVRAAVAAADALRDVDPRARFVWAEPAIHVLPRCDDPQDVAAAEAFRLAQYQAFDMLSGRLEPDLGGRPDLLDDVGINFYPHNQWIHEVEDSFIPMGHHRYRPFSDMLLETWRRYARPILIAETGAEGSARAAWLHYVCDEVRAAMDLGVPVLGICFYPILDYPGWNDGRACPTGLFGPADERGDRAVHQPLAEELRRQQWRFGEQGVPARLDERQEQPR